MGEFHRTTSSCRLSLGVWEYNLLRSWVEAYSKEDIQPSYDGNSIIINMAPANEFSWCGLSKQKMSVKLRDEDSDSPKYCKQIIDWDFNPLQGDVRIDLEAFTDCNKTKKVLDSGSFQCVDWKCTEFTISLHLEQCHRYLARLTLPKSVFDIYNRTCHENNDTCSWEKVAYEKNMHGSFYPFHHITECIEKNNRIPSAVIHFNNVQPLKATKATGTISTREEEATDMVFLSDSQDNLECVMKEFQIQSLGKTLFIIFYLFLS